MKKHHIFVKDHAVNVPLKNTVDKDVQSMLLPFNFLHYLTLCPNYRIKDNVITPNSSISNFVSIVGALAFSLSTVYRCITESFYKQYLGDTTYVYISATYDCVSNCLGFAINLFTGIIPTKSYTEFVLTFQKVHRLLNDETSTRRIIIWNWIAAIVALLGYGSLLTYFLIKLGFPFIKMFSCYFIILFDLKLSYFIRVLKMLEEKVILWNFQVLNSQVMGDTLGQDFSKKMCQAYVDIIKCYKIHKNCFGCFVLFYTVQLFIHALVFIQLSIEILKTGEINYDSAIIASTSIYIWVIKDLSWQTVLSGECEKFYIAIESVQDTAALILKSNCPDDKKLWKNLLRFHRASFSKIRVCGIFYVNAALQLGLLSLLTNNTIVLLQFAIL